MNIPAKLLQSRNEVQTMLSLLYSPEGIGVYTEMAEARFSIEWGELSRDEAHWILMLLGIAQQFQSAGPQRDVLSSLLPMVDRAFANVTDQLSLYQPVLQGIDEGTLSPLEAIIVAGELDFKTGRGVVKTLEDLRNMVANAA